MKKPPHRTTNDRSVFSCSDSQCYVTALGFKTMLPYANRKGQYTFGGGQPCPLADISFSNLCVYLFFYFQDYLLHFLISTMSAKLRHIPTKSKNGEYFYISNIVHVTLFPTKMKTIYFLPLLCNIPMLGIPDSIP